MPLFASRELQNGSVLRDRPATGNGADGAETAARRVQDADEGISRTRHVGAAPGVREAGRADGVAWRAVGPEQVRPRRDQRAALGAATCRTRWRCCRRCRCAGRSRGGSAPRTSSTRCSRGCRLTANDAFTEAVGGARGWDEQLTSLLVTIDETVDADQQGFRVGCRRNRRAVARGRAGGTVLAVLERARPRRHALVVGLLRGTMPTPEPPPGVGDSAGCVTPGGHNERTSASHLEEHVRIRSAQGCYRSDHFLQPGTGSQLPLRRAGIAEPVSGSSHVELPLDVNQFVGQKKEKRGSAGPGGRCNKSWAKPGRQARRAALELMISTAEFSESAERQTQTTTRTFVFEYQ